MHRDARLSVAQTSLLAFVVAAALLGLSGCSEPRNTPAPDPPPTDTAVPAPAAGGMQVHIDPDTGEFLERPPAGAEPMEGDVPAMPREPREVPAPGGGVMIDLDPTDDDSPE